MKNATAIAKLVNVMLRIEIGAARGALVGIRDLRRAAGMSKNEFDAAILEAARAGLLSLHRTDYAAGIDAAELAERTVFVADSEARACGQHAKGIYFIGVAIRQSR